MKPVKFSIHRRAFLAATIYFFGSLSVGIFAALSSFGANAGDGPGRADPLTPASMSFFGILQPGFVMLGHFIKAPYQGSDTKLNVIWWLMIASLFIWSLVVGYAWTSLGKKELKPNQLPAKQQEPTFPSDRGSP
jgi:hypothetical protein